MDERWNEAKHASVLADLGPLPEVVESNSETVWQTFLQLHESQRAGFAETAPSTLTERRLGISVDDVMAEVRRFNRICPSEPNWSRLCAMLRDAAGREPPPPLCGGEARNIPKLTKRIRVRDQVEWAAQNGALQVLAAFVGSLPEDEWIHMGQ